MLKKTLAALAVVSLPAFAAPAPFTGTDYSGVYDCKGVDSHIGDFLGTIEMKRNTQQSTAPYGAYSFTLKLADNSLYEGYAASYGQTLAIHFAHTDPTLKDYGVGVANVTSDLNGKLTLTKYYFAPEYEGGGHGLETCIKR